jgi:hypothetical protein
MHFTLAVIVPFLAIGALAGPIRARDNDKDQEGGLRVICPNLPTQDNGCVRCKLPSKIILQILSASD